MANPAKLFDVAGHVAFVTGAASGLGLAMAEVMAESGATVVMNDIDEAALAAEAARLEKAGLAVKPVAFDVSDAARLQKAIDDAAATYGQLDAVFANAGISSGPSHHLSPDGAIDRVPLDLWQRVLDVNLTSVFLTIRFAAMHMKRQKSGRIVVTSSIAGLQSERMVGYGYCATKAAIVNLVRHAATELAAYNVMVNAICPGPFLTNIAGGRLQKNPRDRALFEEMVPLKRLGLPEELKGLALLLASPASSFITGAIIPIDGGCTAGS